MDILVIANFTADGAVSNNRFNDLCERLARRGAKVELVTSAFSHRFLAPRSRVNENLNYKITYIEELGYNKNISVRRLISQFVFAQRVARYLKNRRVPDVIYCASPPPELARVCAISSARNGAKLVVDIQDLWPEAFRMASGGIDVGSIIFRRMIRSSQIAYAQASLIVAVSRTYASHALRISDAHTKHSITYLGTDLTAFDSIEAVPPPLSTRGEVRMVYVGTLSHSYDLPLVVDALALVNKNCPHLGELELTVIGDGPLKDEYEAYAQKRRVNARFRGRLPYSQLVAELRSFDIAINPIIEGSAASVINKVCDYAAAGLPVINTQDSEEYIDLLRDYGAGISCAPGDRDGVADAIARFADDQELRLRSGAGNRRMAEELFDRSRTYEELVTQVLKLATD